MGGRQEHLMENLDLFRFALTEEDGNGASHGWDES